VTPWVLPPSLASQTRRPLRVALSGPSGRGPPRVVPAQLATSADAFRGATTTPARPATGPVTGGRPCWAVASLLPVTTARIDGGAGAAALPMPGTAAPGRLPGRETVADMRPPAVTVSSRLLTMVRATAATMRRRSRLEPRSPPRRWGLPDGCGQVGRRSAPRALGFRVRPGRSRDGAAQAARYVSPCDPHSGAAGRCFAIGGGARRGRLLPQ